MSVLEEIRAKYAKVEKVSDSYGRIISVRQLTPSQRVHARQLAGSTDPEVIGSMIAAASVGAINDVPYSFPKTRPEVDAVLDMLDEAGIEAVGKAWDKFVTEKEAIESAKNLSATENSGNV